MGRLEKLPASRRTWFGVSELTHSESFARLLSCKASEPQLLHSALMFAALMIGPTIYQFRPS